MASNEDEFGGHLRRLREAAGLSQEELACSAGISGKAVGALERGERKRPHPHTIRALAGALGLADEERAALLAATRRPGVPSTAVGDDRVLSLPPPPTALIGRERAVEAVTGLLDRARLITLTGAGGVGKTRLALEVAREVEERFTDGVAFVSLSPLRDHSLVVPTIAHALGLKEGGLSLRDVLHAGLRGKRMLLLLDNFEHLMEAATEVTALLRGSPNLSVLVTSREALRLGGEQQFPVPPLSVPDLAYVPSPDEVAVSAAAKLFVQRAREVAPDLELTRQNAAAVAALCRRLDGLPLAIELAAALVKLLPPRALLARLDLALPLPAGGSRDLPERQRTMQRTVAWSYDLLSDDEQAAFRALAAFAGGWTLEAAEAVCAPTGSFILEILSSLLDKSLLFAEEAGGGTAPDGPELDEPRFGMLETIRDYGLERLEGSGEEARVRERHARFYLDLAERAAPELYNVGRAAWLERLEAEHENLRAALVWAGEAGQAELGLRLAGALTWFWFHTGYWSEGRRWLEGALARAGTSAKTELRANALYGAGMLACFQGDRAAAYSLLEEGAPLFRELQNGTGLIRVLHLLSLEVLDRGDPARARALAEESVVLSREQGGDLELVGSLCATGMVAQAQGDYTAARSAFEECVAVCRRMGDDWLLSLPLRELGVVVSRQGDHDLAGALTKESLSLLQGAREKWFASRSIEALAMITAARGEHTRAARLYGSAEALQEGMGSSVLPYDRTNYEQGVATARSGMDEQSFASAWAEGRAMTLEVAIAYALGHPAN